MFSSFLLLQLRGQCPDYKMEMLNFQDNGCCHIVTIGFESQDFEQNFSDATDRFGFRFDLGTHSSGVSIVDARAANPLLSGLGVDVRQSGSGSVSILFNIPFNSNDPIDLGFLVNPIAEIEICGDIGDTYSFERLSNPEDLDIHNGPADCPPDPWMGIEAVFTGNIIEGLVQTAGGRYDCSDGGSLVEGTEFSISNFIQTDITSSDNRGEFSTTRCDDAPYEICAITTCDMPCGLTAMDITWGQNYLLYGSGGSSFNDFIFEYVGDVNESGHFSVGDLVLMNQWILGVERNDYPDSWCKFYPQSEVTPGNVGTLLDQCVTSSNTLVGENDFTRISLGDMDGSCNDCIHGDGMGEYPIIIVDEGDGVSLYVSSDHQKLYGLSLDIEMSGGTLGFICSDILANKSVLTTDRGLRLSWFDLNEELHGQELSDDIALLRIDGIHPEQLSLIHDSGNTVIGTDQGVFIPKLIRGEVASKSKNTLIIKHSSLQEERLRCADPQRVKIYNLSGQLLLDRPITSNLIDLSTISLKPDLYVISIEYSDGTNQIIKSMLQ